MTDNLLPDYLDHIREAALDACGFVEGFKKEDFLVDKRTQRAVVMSLIIIGEAATRVMEGFPDFADRYPDVPWRGMRGLRNRMAHGYFDLNLDLVWETVHAALPKLIGALTHMEQNEE